MDEFSFECLFAADAADLFVTGMILGPPEIVHACCAGAHLEECAERQTLKAEADALRETAAAEKEAHGHAIRQYVVEVELRSQLQSQVAEERSAKEHAVFLRSVAEKKILQLQVIPRSCPQQNAGNCAIY